MTLLRTCQQLFILCILASCILCTHIRSPAETSAAPCRSLAADAGELAPSGKSYSTPCPTLSCILVLHHSCRPVHSVLRRGSVCQMH